MLSYEGVGKIELEDEADAVGDFILTAIQMAILQQLMGGGKQVKGRASAGLVEVHFERETWLTPRPR